MNIPHVGRVRHLRRWIAASIAAVTVLGTVVFVSGPAASPVLAAQPEARSGQPYVRVEGVRLERSGESAVVRASVIWNADGVTDRRMIVGDLRLVAVSDEGHLPFLLDAVTQDVSADQTRSVTFTIDDEKALAAMRIGNRIVLTASQHERPGQVTRTTRTYVTVAEVQPHGTPRSHIGTEDCSDIAIVPGAVLYYCDLVGADLDGALVSIHDPKSDDGRVDSQSTRMERADLTGATAVRSDFSGASIAGGRINGIDLRDAKLDNLSLAGTEAVEIQARGATSDKDARDSGANMFNANLRGSDLSATVFRGVSVMRARLDGADLHGATWESLADGATFRGADLSNTVMGASQLHFADFTDAILRGSTLNDLQLAWTWLCRTTLPEASTLDRVRDCRAPVEPPRAPIDSPDQADPYVVVDGGAVADGPGPRTVTARITWNTGSISPAAYGMSVGDLRLLAIDGTSGVPTVLDTRTLPDLSSPTDYAMQIDDPAKLRAMSPGNRIVLTATQHPPRARGGKYTMRSYVTVDVLQRGAGRGRIGGLDCSRVALTMDSARPLDFCDLAGAMLDTAALTGRSMRQVDLAGATARDSLLGGLFLDGARAGGLQASGATLSNVSALDLTGPRLDLSDSSITGSPLYPRTLDDANFARAKVIDSPLAAASLRRADFTNAKLIHPDLAYTDLRGASFVNADATQSNPSLFLADLTRSDMSGSRWNDDESGANPMRWAVLCRTAPPTSPAVDGDRDCPR